MTRSLFDLSTFVHLAVPPAKLLAMVWILQATLLPVEAQTGSATSQPEGTPIHWPRQDFVIPFQIDPAGDAPSEVRLEVSEDQGKSWSLYTRSDVRVRQFNYHAARDGEFRFRLKTVDRAGNVFDNPGAPLQIIVDTTKPNGELVVDMDPRGALQAEFRLVDPHLDTDAIDLEYQTDSHSQWEPIPFELSPGTEIGEWIGFGAWNIPAEATQLMVRVHARDRAGNQVELTRMPRLPRSASMGSNMKFASNHGPESQSRPIGSGILNRGLPPSVVAANEIPVPKVEVLGGPGARRATSESNLHPLAGPLPQVLPSSAIEKQNRLLMQQRVVGIPSSPGNIPSDPDNGARSLLPTRPLANEGWAESPKPQASLTSSTSGPSPSGLEPIPPQPRPASILAPSLESARQQPQRERRILHSSSKVFGLDYTVENDPGAPISNVELWGTTDQGARWEKWGIDSDRQSPFDIEVESEGLFGFRMVIVGANGLASRRPLPGDDADAWIQVDTTPPQAKIISVLNGKGPDAGALVIEYLAIDDHFSERPISLSFAETPTGPWQPITQSARNQGRFVWPSDPSLPATVFIRLDAVDAAGNLSSHQLDLPVDVQGAAPRGRIQGFRPQR